MKKIIISVCLVLLLLVMPISVYGYTVRYSMQNFYTSPDANATSVSIYWPGSCDVSITLNTTAGTTPAGPYSLSHTAFSPDFTQVISSPKTRFTNITCQNQFTTNTDQSFNDYYEATTRTEFSSDTVKTWITTTYDCSPDANDLFIYSNTNLTDSYGNFPFHYARAFDTCFQQSPGQCTNTLTTELGQVIDYIQESIYFNDCAEDLEQDRPGKELVSGNSGGVSSDLQANYWSMVPFNSESTGIVNISVIDREFSFGGAGNCGSGPVINSQYYIWDTVTNQTFDLGTTFPLSTQRSLFPNRNYWLFIGSRYLCNNFNFGALEIIHDSTSYEITIDACETDYQPLTNFSACQDNVQQRTLRDESNCNAPDITQERACFDVPPFDLTLGFEEFVQIDDGVYICTKAFGTCANVLSTIDAKYPVNWTIVGEEDVTGTNRANYIKVSEESASVGSRSLKMWYIPPKINEPIADSPTTCGNLTSGRSPEVNHPYNDTLFLSLNVTFDNPFAQIRYDVRKCDEPVLQYDYTGDLLGFNCGKMCYAQSCNGTATGEPLGRYGLRVSTVDSEETEVFETFSFFDDVGNNETVNVTDGNVNTFSAFSSSSPGAKINFTGNIFRNDTLINLVLNVSGGIIPLCFFDGATELARFTVPSATTIFTYNVTLGNFTNPTNHINLRECNAPSRTVQMRKFEIINIVVNMTPIRTVFDFVGFAPDTWDAGQMIHDLSNVNLQAGENYTIALSINPENQFDPSTHCVYVDNFRATFTETALPDCESRCIENSVDEQLASLSGGVCTFTIRTNSPNCVANPDDRAIIEAILAGLGGGSVSDNSTCFDSDNDGVRDDLYIFDSERAMSEIVIDSEACIQAIVIPPTTVETGESLFEQILEFLGMKIFWALVVCGIVFGSVFVTSASLAEKASWEGATILTLIAVVFFMVVEWIPLEVGALIILPSGLMVVHEFRKAT